MDELITEQRQEVLSESFVLLGSITRPTMEGKGWDEHLVVSDSVWEQS